MDMILPDPDRLRTFFERLRAVYDSMEEAYDEAALHYGFTCEGCTDNCCTQRFFHHTLSEYLYLMEGMKTLDDERRAEVLTLAKVVTDTYPRELEAGEILPLMCPLNFGGLCALYEYRPMICRAHGLPHRFQRPDGKNIEGGGCHRFEAEHLVTVYIDRTEFYRGLAELERDLRAELGFTGRYKKTTAQMLLDMTEHLGLDS